MHSSTLILGLLAGGVLSSPAHHGAHKHSPRQQVVDVVDVVNVYTTVTAGFAAASPKAADSNERIAIHPDNQQGGNTNPQGFQQHEEEYQPPTRPQQPAPSVTPPTSSAPVASPSGGSGGSGGGQTSGNTYLDMHNKFRAAHGAVPMTWDSALASKAAGQAGSCPSNDVQ